MRTKAKRKDAPTAEPTPEQQRNGEFVVEDIMDKGRGGVLIRIGKAYRRKPMIEVLHAAGLFTDAELKALKHYRHHAELVERSPLRDSLAFGIPGRNGNGPTITHLNASFLVGQIERAVGSLTDILRAVAVDDSSLSQWAMKRSGSVEKRRQHRGQWRTTFEPKPYALAIAKLEMKIAAQRVEAELVA